MKPITDQYNDIQVIAKILDGDSGLYEILIRRYNPFLYRIGRTYHYTHAETEDLMQETYVQAYFNLAKFENRSTFKTWLTRIMLNNCYQQKQKLRYRKEVASSSIGGDRPGAAPLFHQSSNSEKIMVNKELARVLENALTNIPEDYRIVFTLRELNGLSVSETVESLQISESNVKVRLNRAKKMLRTEIEKMYSADEIFEFNLIYCDRMVDHVMAAIRGHTMTSAPGGSC
jgi:RNA polymerase sigma-70 factor (ECF subfamily)